MPRKPTPAQERGTQFGGKVLQNTLQPRRAVSDMPPKDQARLIKKTGQSSDPAATARERNFQGQKGPEPRAPLPPKYMR